MVERERARFEGEKEKEARDNSTQPNSCKYVPPVILAEMVSGGFFESMIACMYAYAV